MPLKDLARVLGIIYAQIDAIERELKQAVVSGLRLERLMYSFPKAIEVNIDELREEMIRSLGGKEGEDLLEVIRKSFAEGKGRVVGRKRCAIVIIGTVNDEIVKELSSVSGAQVRVFNATAYPLASAMEVLDYDPDYVIFLSPTGGVTSVSELKAPEPLSSDELNGMISLSPPGTSEAGLLAGIMGSLGWRGRGAWILSCATGGMRECMGTLRGLLADLGFSY